MLNCLGTQKVDVAGGEPLVSPALPYVVDALDEFRIYSTITTSAAASARAKRWLISNCQRFCRIAISVDGPALLHDAMRGRVGSYDNAFELAAAISGAGGVVRINSVITKGLLVDRRIANLARAVAGVAPSEWMLIQPHPANQKQFFQRHAISGHEFRTAIVSAGEALGALPGRPKVSLLTRDLARYSRYWLIYPDGLLAQHTGGPTDMPGINLLTEDIDRVRGHMMKALSGSALARREDGE
jgi:molybdenum cofactor biosynthesis enzyme MoaA